MFEASASGAVPAPRGRPTRDLYRLIEHATDYVVALDSDNLLSYVSPSVERDFGFAAAELLGRPVLEFVHPEDVTQVVEAIASSGSGANEPARRDVRIRGRDERYRSIEIVVRNLLDDPEISAIVLNGRDVTERSRAEARFRAVFDTSAIGMALVAPDGSIVQANTAFARMLGYTPEEMSRLTFAELTHPDDVEESVALAGDLFAGRRDSYVIEKRYLRSDGAIVWGRLTVSLTPGDDGGPGLALGLIEDITDRKQAEESLDETSHRLNAILEASPLAIVSVDLDGLVVSWNPAAERMFGWSAGETIGAFVPQVGEEFKADFQRLRDTVLETGDVVSATVTRRRKDGSAIDVALSTGPLRDRSGALIGLTAVLADVTETRKAQRLLAETERRYRVLVENLPAVTYIDRIVSTEEGVGYEQDYVSPQVQTLLGYTPARWGEDLIWERCLHPDDRDRVLAYSAERVRAEQPIDQEYRLLAADGHVVWIHEQSLPLRDGSDLRWQGVMFDVTETKVAELALRAAQERFRVLVEQIPAVTYADDDTPEHAGLYISPQIRDLIGVEAEDAMADHSAFRRHIHPDDEAGLWKAWDEARGAGRPFEAEYRVVHEDGTVRWVWERSTILRDEGRPTIVQGVLFDVSDRKRAEEILRESEAEVRRSLDALRQAETERRELLLRHLLVAEAAERERLAEGIEDRSIQDFAAVGLRLETLRRTLDDPEQRGAVDRLGETVQQALARLRHLLVELHPRELETEGLVAALERYARGAAPAGVHVAVSGRLEREPEPERRAVSYRMAQDAVAFALGRATDGIAIEVRELDGGIVVRVSSRGPAGSPNEGDEELVSIRERVEAAGGRITAGGGSDGGGRLEVWLPGGPEASP